MERAGSSTKAFCSYWSKPVVIFTNMQQKGSTLIQEQRLLNLRGFEALLMMCASLHLRCDVPDLQKNWAENKSEEEPRKCRDTARKQSTFLLWKSRTFENAQTEDEHRDGWIVFHYTKCLYLRNIYFVCMERLRRYNKVKFSFNARQDCNESIPMETKFGRQSEVRVWHYNHTIVSVTCP